MALFPQTIGQKEVTITHDQPAVVTYSESGVSQARRVGGHLWNINAVFRTMEKSEIAPLVTFLARRGRLFTFTFISDQHKTPLGTALGSPKVLITTIAGASSILTYGWTPSQTAALKEGDLVKFNGHSKVYTVGLDMASDGAGAGTLTIYPNLIMPLSSGEVITVSSVPFTVRADDDLIEWKTNRQGWSEYSLKMIEAI